VPVVFLRRREALPLSMRFRRPAADLTVPKFWTHRALAPARTSESNYSQMSLTASVNVQCN
jgi:hypothetical protein